MSEVIVAKRYADALFQLADDKNKAKAMIDELAVVKEVFQTNDKLVQLLNHPSISNHKKLDLIDKAFHNCDQDIINTLKILIERQRIDNIQGIINQVTELYNEANGIAYATVSSVRELSDSEKQNIINSLKEQLGKKEILINNIVDSSVLGGLKIRVGNTIYDGTISHKLHSMKRSIGTKTT